MTRRSSRRSASGSPGSSSGRSRSGSRFRPIHARELVVPAILAAVASGAGIYAVRAGRGARGLERDRHRLPRRSGSATSRRARASTTSRSSSPGRPDRLDARLRHAAHLRVARRHLLRAERRREHRPRGDDAHGRVLGHLGSRRDGLLGHGRPHRHGCRRAARAPARVLLRPPARRPDRRRNGDQPARDRHHRLRVRPALRHGEHPGRASPRSLGSS